MIYYIIYETTNLVNNKKYRGAHVCYDLDDGYLGSGTNIRHAIKKYGKQSFTRVILYMAFDYDAMWAAESIFVDQQWVDRPDTYNISLGGRGSRGFKRTILDSTRLLQGAISKARWEDPVYRAKTVASQKSKSPPTDASRRKMSLSRKGIPKTPEHSNNISLGLKKMFEDPAARQKRSDQAKITNSRPEVQQKISIALTGIKRSDSTKQKNKIAAQKRSKDPVYLERQSVSQTLRWKERPAAWWNNGNKSVRSVDQPGPEWNPGRLTFGTWWNNGHSTKMSVECPGPEWVPGRRLVTPQN